MAKKMKEKEKARKRRICPNTLSHTSPKNIHRTYLHRKNAIPSIVYVPCVCIQNHIPFYCAIRSSWDSSSLQWSSFM
jgi:hypothetical protein